MEFSFIVIIAEAGFHPIAVYFTDVFSRYQRVAAIRIYNAAYIRYRGIANSEDVVSFLLEINKLKKEVFHDHTFQGDICFAGYFPMHLRVGQFGKVYTRYNRRAQYHLAV